MIVVPERRSSYVASSDDRDCKMTACLSYCRRVERALEATGTNWAKGRAIGASEVTSMHGVKAPIDATILVVVVVVVVGCSRLDIVEVGHGSSCRCVREPGQVCLGFFLFTLWRFS